jgi:hypothetical protein
MANWLSMLRRRPAFKPGPMLHARQTTTTKNGQFLSYLGQAGFRRVNPAKYERAMRYRRAALAVFFWALIAGFSWVVIESAQALSMF